MFKISLKLLISLFGYNQGALVGRMVSTIDGRTTNGRGSGKGRTMKIKQFSGGGEFHNGKSWYNTSDFYLTTLTLQDLDQILAGFNKIAIRYKEMRNYMTERGLKEYNPEEVGIQKVIALVKKNNHEEARKVILSLMDGAID